MTHPSGSRITITEVCLIVIAAVLVLWSLSLVPITV